MNIPNYLTISRLVFPFLIFFIILLNLDLKIERIIILILFILLSLTDYLDGYLARKYKLESVFGKTFDPVSDKVLTSTALLYILSFEDKILLPALLILAREIIVSGVREYMILKNGKSIDVIFLSKLKTAFQFISIIFFLLLDFELYYFNITNLAYVCIWITTILTLYTGFQYSYYAYNYMYKRKKK